MIGDSNCYHQKRKSFVKMTATKITYHLKTEKPKWLSLFSF